MGVCHRTYCNISKTVVIYYSTEITRCILVEKHLR